MKRKKTKYIKIGDGVPKIGAGFEIALNNPVFERLLAIFFLALGLYGLVKEISVGFFEGQDLIKAFYAGLLLSLVWLFILDRRKKLKIILLFVFFVAVFAALYNYREHVVRVIENAIYNIGRYINWYMNGRSEVSFDSFADFENDIKLNTQSAFAILVPWCLLVTYSWSRRGHFLTSLFALTAYLIMFFSSGYMLDFYSMAYISICLIGLSVKNRIKAAEDGKKKKHYLLNVRQEMALIVAVAVAVFFSDIFYDEIKGHIQPVQDMLYDSFEKSDEIEEKISMGINGGDINEAQNIRSDKSVKLYITSDYDIGSCTYLKGYVADSYKKGKWENKIMELSPDDDLDYYYALLSLEYNFIDIIVNDEYSNNAFDIALSDKVTVNSIYNYLEHNRIKIESVGEDVSQNGYVCMPYCSLVDDTDGDITDGLYLKRREAQGSINYYDCYTYKEGFDPGSKKGFFGAYSYTGGFKDLHTNLLGKDIYLEVPSELSAIYDQYGGIRYDNIEDAIVFVQNELNAGYEYTTTPGSAPSGTDPIYYFMYESKKGFCMHYASAAVMIFRSMGIPARYVEGYVAPELKANERTAVYDYTAHAWPEIYVENYGWIPVEVTNTAVSLSDPDKIPDNSTEKGTQSGTTRPNKETKTETAKADSSSAETKENTKPVITGTEAEDDDAGNEKNAGLILKVILIIVIIALLAGLLLAIYYLQYKLYELKLEKSYRSGYKDRLLLTYKRIYRLTRRNECIIEPEGLAEHACKLYRIEIGKVEGLYEELLNAEFGNRDTREEACRLAEDIEMHLIKQRLEKAGRITRIHYKSIIRVRKKVYAGK